MDLVIGIHAVLEALTSGGRPVERLVVLRGRQDRRMRDVLEAARARHVPVRSEDRAGLDRLTEGQNHQGVVALVAGRSYATEEQVLAGAGERPFLVLLDQVQDPRNLGAVVRSAAAAGADGVFLTDRGTAPASAAAARAAAGALDRIPLVRVGNLVALLERLKERGIWTVGLAADGEDLWSGFDLSLPLALVVGGEGKGLRRLVRERCEVVLGIPMPGGGGSLNLAAAATVALFEVVRRRAGAASPHGVAKRS